MSDMLKRWTERIEAEFAAEVERGEHDAACESYPNSRLCHCRMRRRIASGLTEPPGELIHQAPLCPQCLNEVNVDADGFDCGTCSVSWGSDGVTAWFNDDYGDLSATAPGQQAGADR